MDEQFINSERILNKKNVRFFCFLFLFTAGILLIAYMMHTSNKLIGCTPMKFSIEKLGEKVSCEVIIAEDEAYAPMLAFERKDNSFEELTRIQKALGDAYRIRGAGMIKRNPTTSVKVTISKKDGANQIKIIEKVVDPHITSSNSHAEEAELLKQRLLKGTYIIQVESLKDSPLMAEVDTSFRFIKAYRGL